MSEPSVFKKSDPIRAKSPWCCRWSEYVDGRRRTREAHFPSKTKALAKKSSLVDGSRKGRRSYSDVEYREIEHALGLCSEHDVGLLEMVQAGLETRSIHLDAVTRKVPTIHWAVEAYIYDGEKRNLRPDTLKGYRSMLEPFKEGRAERLISTVTGDELLKYILNRYSGDESRKNVRARLRGLMNFCAAKEQGWCAPLPADALQWKVSQAAKPDPVVYSVEEAEALIKASPDYLKCGVAIGLFAGVRPKEILRLRWDDGEYGVDFKRRIIRIHPERAKIWRSRTLHDLPDNLWAWLERYRPALPLNAAKDAAERVVPVTEEKWYKHLRAAAATAGIDKRTATGLPAKDVMRHSFGSYGRHRGLEWAVQILGHTGGLAVFNDHYNNSAANAEDAADYFSIVPE